MEEKFATLDNLALVNLHYYMPESATLRQLADIFSLFSDVTRLKILSALSISPMCVNDLSRYLGINQTTISHQLKFLKSYNFVSIKRSGKIIVYSLATDLVNSVLCDVADFIDG